jgi:hypothetical protein
MDNSNLYKIICGKFISRIIFVSLLFAFTLAVSSFSFINSDADGYLAGILVFFIPLLSFEVFILASIISSKMRKTMVLKEIINITGFDDVRIKNARPDSVNLAGTKSGFNDFILQIRKENEVVFDMVFRKREKNEILQSLDPIMKKAGIRIINSYGLRDAGNTNQNMPDLSYFVFEM